MVLVLTSPSTASKRWICSTTLALCLLWSQRTTATLPSHSQRSTTGSWQKTASPQHPHNEHDPGLGGSQWCRAYTSEVQVERTGRKERRWWCGQVVPRGTPTIQIRCISRDVPHHHWPACSPLWKTPLVSQRWAHRMPVTKWLLVILHCGLNLSLVGWIHPQKGIWASVEYFLYTC